MSHSLNHSIIHELYEIGAIQFGDFTLKSGEKSSTYIDLRLIISYPKLLKKVCLALTPIITSPSLSPFDLLCGVPYAALPIASIIGAEQEIPMIIRRKEVKEHGTKKIIEGAYKEGQTCLILEDVLTTGLSILETVESLEKEGLLIKDVVVVLNREQGGEERLNEKGLCVHSLISISQIYPFLQNIPI